MKEISLNQTLSSVNDDPLVKFKHDLEKREQVIKNLIRENQKLVNKIEELQNKQNLIQAEAKRWKQEFKCMSEKYNAILKISEARLDLIDDLCDEMFYLDNIAHYKPF